MRERAAGKTLGMVPTMGALHEGHLSLIRRAHEENDVVFCSIFVNPVQFNNAEDLQKYPRTLEADVQLIGDLADYVFAPTVEEVFPVAPTEVYDFGPVANVMEGAARPGHFNGVGVIVRRLLEWVRPHKSYFGEKDYQQIAVVKEMCRQCRILSEIVPCPIVREDDGLAKSSRNTYLNPEERQAALILSQSLKKGREAVEQGERDSQRVISIIRENLETEPLARIDYVDVVDFENIQRTPKIEGETLVAIAVYIGKTRLIDNFIVNI